MKIFLVILFFIFNSTFAFSQTNWTKINELYVNADNSYYPLAIFFNSYNNPNQYPNIPSDMTINKWVTVDLKPLGVSSDAKFAILGGMFLITGGADIHLAFRKPGDIAITPSHYQQQSFSWSTSGGERSVSWDYVPLVDGKFEIYLYAAPYGYYSAPTIKPNANPAVGINLKLKGWGK